MIFGDPSTFAIESGIYKAYDRPFFSAWGFFVIYVRGRCYGVREKDATMLMNSFGEVEDRIRDCGRHVAPFAGDADAGAIASAFRNAVYGENPAEHYFGMPLDDFRNFFYTMHCSRTWAPDGDEAFDDGSYVLQFDVGDEVRLIAFKSDATDLGYDPATLGEARMPADEYYGVLERWRDSIQAEWQRAPKEPDYTQ